MNILVLDDELEIAELIELYLVNEGYNVFKSHTGKDALEKIENVSIDLAILDLMLPDIDGFEVAKKIRLKYKFPIIMLTARDEDISKIKGLNIGADDYMTKPFKPIELLARVKAHLRCYNEYNEIIEEKLLEIGSLKLDTKGHLATLKTDRLNLTPTEFEILKILIENKNFVVSSEMIFQKVWKEKYYSDSNNTVMVHIRNIRKKMGDSFDEPEYIQTVWGVGYKIEEE